MDEADEVDEIGGVDEVGSTTSRPSATRLERRPLAIIAIVWAVCTLLWLTPGVTKPDGAGYYVYLPSSWFDRDLLFFDEWYSFGLVVDGRILFKEITATEHLGNHWASGSAVFWFPSFAVGDLLSRANPSWSPPQSEGLSFPYLAACVVASAIAGLLTLVAGYLAARRYFSPFISVAAVLGVWFGSPLMWYALRNSLMSHAPGALATSIVVLLALRFRDGKIGGWDLAAFGLACGFAFAIRPQNSTLAVVPLILIPISLLKPTLRRTGALLLGFGIGALPQLVVSQFLYGSPIGFMRLGGGPSRPFAPFERVWIWEPLLSWFHGMIPWTPLLALSIAGFFFLARHDRRLAIAAVYVFASQWAINAVLERSFWGGYAFGQRRFDNCTIFFVLGAAAFFTHAPRWVSWLLSIAAAGWTTLLFFAGFRNLDLNQYQTASEIGRAALDAARDLGAHLVPLGAVPPEFRVRLLVVLVAVAAMFAAILIGLATATPRQRVAIAAAYLLVVSGIFFVAGWSGNVARYRNLVDSNKELGIRSGAVDFRIGLLEQEARFLRKSGRDGEAMETERELEALLRARRAPP